MGKWCRGGRQKHIPYVTVYITPLQFLRVSAHIIEKFLNFSVDCRLIQPESKFKFVEALDSEAGFDFYNVSFSPFYGTSFLLKTLMDKLLSLFFIIISLPIIIICSLLIILEDGFPIFFKQERTGWDGKSFNILKLRSLKKMKNNGILLALITKNELDDVKNLFKEKSEYELDLEDFSAIIASWEQKSKSVLFAKEEFNVGLESIIYVDDNYDLRRDTQRQAVLIILDDLEDFFQ